MGFEVTSDGAVAHLPDQPPTVQQSSRKVHATQKTGETTTVHPVSNQPETAFFAKDKVNGTFDADAKLSVSAAAASGSQQSLYEIIRQRSQVKPSTRNKESTSSSDADEVVPSWNSKVNQNYDVDCGLDLQHQPSVKFCLEKNAFISASSAEESQCR